MSADNVSLTPRGKERVQEEWTYRIGDLAREFNVTLRTLRFYEDKGLIKPKRKGTTRLYDQEDRDRLELALFCKRIGLSLTEIRAILELKENEESPDASTPAIRRVYAGQKQVLEDRRLEIEAAINELNARIDELGGH